MISVIICTYNPNLDYLNRVLTSLKDQTLSKKDWELLIIDNNSSNQFDLKIDLSWHDHSKIIKEKQQGLTYARIRGISNAKGDLIIFVDDDNLINEDYLEKSLVIAKDWPLIGVWGGNIDGEFETKPEDWTKDYWYYLAIRNVDKNFWANDILAQRAEPCGAGLCIRKEVGKQYIEELISQPIRKKLGRVNNQLISGEDTDIVLTSLEMGLGMGVFTTLKMRHIIPSQRLTETYLLKLMEGLKYSHIILSKIRGNSLEKTKYTTIDKIKNLYNVLKLSGRAKKFYIAKIRGEKRAYEFIKKHNL